MTTGSEKTDRTPTARTNPDQRILTLERALALKEKELLGHAALTEVATAVGSDLSLEAFLTLVAEKLSHVLETSGCALSMWYPERNVVETLIDYNRIYPDDVEAPGTFYLLEDYPATKAVLESGRPIVIQRGDPHADPAELELLTKDELATLLMLPLMARNKVLGLMELIEDDRTRDFAPEEIRLGQSLASHAAIAIENARLYHQAKAENRKRKKTQHAIEQANLELERKIEQRTSDLQAVNANLKREVELHSRAAQALKAQEAQTGKRLAEQTALRQAISAISSRLELGDVLTHIVEQMCLAIDATSTYINSWNLVTGEARVMAEYFSPQACKKEKVPDLDNTYTEFDSEFVDSLKQGIAVVDHVDDLEIPQEDREMMARFGACSILFLPLQVKGHAIAYAEVWESRRRREFTAHEIALCQDIAQNAAMAMEHARLYKQVQQELTERRQAQRAMEVARDEALAASRAKSEFLANMSHELRTPLNHIIGFTELVADGQVGDLIPIQIEYLNDALGSSRHLLSLINDILDLSKIEAGKLELKPTDIDVADLIRDSQKMVAVRAAKQRIRVDCETDDLPAVIRADERKLRQIMYNLLSNAVKFTADGGLVRIVARSLRSTERGLVQEDGFEIGRPPGPAWEAQAGGRFLGIWVSDTGIGLDPDHFERIFKPFEQVDGSASRRYSGTGLGLYLCKQFVELHGGRIWAESEGRDSGTTFWVIIPMR